MGNGSEREREAETEIEILHRDRHIDIGKRTKV